MSSRPSPLQNRVAPDGAIEADPARGTLMGNRGGRLHEGWRLARAQASRRWIACLPCFRGRHRKVWRTGYTELFFLDDATALAAGHRPCFECRRADARAFAAAWGRATGEPPPRASAMDRVLADQRGHPQPPCSAAALPEGTIARAGGRILLIAGGAARPWSHAGYGPPEPLPAQAVPLTPPAIRAALAAGYRPRDLPGP